MKQILINKPIYLCLSTLDLSKTVMYNFIKPNMVKIQKFIIWIQTASLFR